MSRAGDGRRKMSHTEELKDRVEAKKLRLQAKLRELRADTRSTSRDEAKKLQDKLDALGESLKGGWGDLSDTVSGKLNDWLKDD
jgi:predicted trehalose synthase